MWGGMALDVGTWGSIFIKLIKRNNFVLSFRNAGAVKGADTGAKFSSSLYQQGLLVSADAVKANVIKFYYNPFSVPVQSKNKIKVSPFVLQSTLHCSPYLLRSFPFRRKKKKASLPQCKQ